MFENCKCLEISSIPFITIAACKAFCDGFWPLFALKVMITLFLHDPARSIRLAVSVTSQWRSCCADFNQLNSIRDDLVFLNHFILTSFSGIKRFETWKDLREIFGTCLVFLFSVNSPEFIYRRHLRSSEMFDAQWSNSICTDDKTEKKRGNFKIIFHSIKSFLYCLSSTSTHFPFYHLIKWLLDFNLLNFFYQFGFVTVSKILLESIR